MRTDNIIKLINEGKIAEAQTLKKKLMENAGNDPDDVRQELWKPEDIESRGRPIVQDEAGNWVVKDSPRRKK